MIASHGRGALQLSVGTYTSTHYQVLFFFSSRRRHTRLQGDWSSDVCSSDLQHRVPAPGAAQRELAAAAAPAAHLRGQQRSHGHDAWADARAYKESLVRQLISA